MFRLIAYTVPAWLVILCNRFFSRQFVGDDSYMTFKVARNFLEGLGFIYNEGEIILGTTTPLWAAVIAGFSFIFSLDPLEVFRPVVLFFDLLNCFFIVVLASCKGRFVFRGMVAALLFSLSWHMNYASSIGMEASFFISLLLGVTLLLEKQSTSARIGAAVLASLSFMTRPEGVFVIMSAGIVYVLKNRKMPWLEMGVVTILVSGYLGYMYLFFGTLVPHAGMAKSIAYYRQPLQAHFSLGDHIAMLTISNFFDDPGLLGLFLPYLLWFLWVYGVVSSSRESLSFLVPALFTLMVLVLYTVMNPLLFEWYVVPLEVSYVVSLVWAVCALLRKLTGQRYQIAYVPGLVVLGSVFIVLAMNRYELPRLSFVMVDGPGGYRNWPSLGRDSSMAGSSILPLLGPDKRESHYVELARLIESEVSRETVVIAPEYGAFGYHTSSKMLSSIGHNNKEMLNFLPAPQDQVVPYMNNAVTQEMIDAFQPDYVLSLEAFIRRSLLRSGRFLEEYEQIAYRPSQVFSSRGLYLFRRKKNDLSDP
jgi:hypothetical protein